MLAQVGFAVADGGDALLGFTRALKAPGAMIVPIEATHNDCLSQQLTLVQKAICITRQHTLSFAPGRHSLTRAQGIRRRTVAHNHRRDSFLQGKAWNLP